MKTILLTSACLALVAASPVNPPAPTPTTTTATTTTTTTTTSSTTSSTTAPSIGNLCQGAGGSQPSGGLGGILNLGKLEECAGNTLSDKPLGGILGGVGGIIGN
ncbi:hypothetical protein BDV18DRAFT_161083 [Aspergillus unguis]